MQDKEPEEGGNQANDKEQGREKVLKEETDKEEERLQKERLRIGSAKVTFAVVRLPLAVSDVVNLAADGQQAELARHVRCHTPATPSTSLDAVLASPDSTKASHSVREAGATALLLPCPGFLWDPVTCANTPVCYMAYKQEKQQQHYDHLRLLELQRRLSRLRRQLPGDGEAAFVPLLPKPTRRSGRTRGTPTQLRNSQGEVTARGPRPVAATVVPGHQRRPHLLHKAAPSPWNTTWSTRIPGAGQDAVLLRSHVRRFCDEGVIASSTKRNGRPGVAAGRKHRRHGFRVCTDRVESITTKH
ncbi:hypothetical protein HPB50_001921 [Hyalomma asiaticum]|uniref:Uncharacterized protein n=1 Tax=Hyalomma asiaticum TaxID=266040 RepID=A0ACB7TAR6_HYAAI|nr:hypothetical protein HPB50_001921 [Hyalomma asiaticum]